MTTRRPTFTIMAGVEIAGGQLATLHHGQIDSTHTYGSPAEAARHFVAQGAQWLHVADLDAAAARLLADVLLAVDGVGHRSS